jgi:EAL domain-containing protein (putative c-di-GMP-specific phosphodiesterase class I)/CheY-like chemotaxis protein
MKAAASGEDATGVLVVDDDPGVARSLQRLLSGAGYRVVVAGDGRAAAEALSRDAFAVIVSDIEMPGMSGVELLQAVRDRELDVPVILMTGAPTIDTAMEAVSLGALQYLTKPTSNTVMLKSVERATQLCRMAAMKREALSLLKGSNTWAGDLGDLQAGLERALDTMWMAFQPIVDVSIQRVFGYEALMRSKEPSLPHPGAVLDAAERLNRTEHVGRRVRALSAAAFALAPPDVLLFVNLHLRDLLDASLYEDGAPLTKIAKRVVFEITERSTIDGVADVQSRVSELRRLGYRIAIDDLGAGYAGLSSFAALEPDIVKLDMSLVRNVHQSDVRQRLIGSMTRLCNEMDMQVVAEGVEVLAERDTVRGLGCTLLQGYLFAKPGPPFPVPSILE